MGEVRVKVKLTNSYDESRRQRGDIGKDEVRKYEAFALVNTGSVSSVIPAGMGSRRTFSPLSPSK